MNELNDFIQEKSAVINQALDCLLPAETVQPQRLHAAMRYSIFAGGKRLRPLLCLAAAEACGGKESDAMHAACAVEMLHTYTLIHDDLPALDDDELRRGRPACHIQFGEATAILAGDALLTLSFEILAGIPQAGTALVLELARAAGSCGVIGGQMIDIESEGKTPDAETVNYIHRNKTAALIRAACTLGGICAGGSPAELEKLAEFGENIGLAFQLTDDLLDERASVAQLGKNTGVDKARGKITWPAVYGVEKTEADARQMELAALDALKIFPAPERLRQLAHFIIRRNF
ncbi:MAG: polyprenyl synthetase family protein [Kiritimatiellales bacterium]